jgi:uncharacterized LabA/DUF88 family protein
MQNPTNGSVARRRVMIFIDGSNLYHVLRQNTDKRNLDYKKFAEKLCGDRELIRTYYYNIRQESTSNPKLAESQDRFLNALYETEYLEVKLGIWKQRGDTMVEKGVDVMIAADLISHAYEDHYDTAILVSGDADFYPALQVVKDTGKQVEVAAFDSNLSSEAARASDVLVKFQKNYFDDLWMSSSQQSQNIRAAERRKTVSDEAASPNGEDKGAMRAKTTVRRPFTERYADRRKTYRAQTSDKTATNGHHAPPIARSARRPERRRSLTSILSHGSSGARRVERRGAATISASRVTPPDLRGSSEEEGSAPRVQPTDGRRERRDSWISRMLKSRR